MGGRLTFIPKLKVHSYFDLWKRAQQGYHRDQWLSPVLLNLLEKSLMMLVADSKLGGT